MSVRNIPLFFLVGVPALSRMLPTTTKRRAPKPAPLAAAVLLGLFTIVAATGVAVAWRRGGVLLGWKPMSGSAVEAVRSCQGPLFNGFTDGGVIALVRPRASHLRRQPRCGSVPIQLLLRSREADLSGNYRQLFQDFDIGCAAVAAASPIARQLAADGIFRQQYADDQWVVFARTTR